jgi:hypothetical protein
MEEARKDLEFKEQLRKKEEKELQKRELRMKICNFVKYILHK